ncbi:probable enterobactin synthase component F at N-terminal half [Coccomyxa sp. Obi]|nr:probable enterobactin synthase component F at N-terminal half [Coccomyxa sp. Obi]
MELLSHLDGAFRPRQHQLSILQDFTDQRISWTYRDIGERVAALSSRIATEKAHSASNDQNIPIVGLFLNTSIASVIGTLAILHARAAFMPLDCSWPLSKLKAMLDDAHPVLVLWADKECHGCGPLAYTGCPLLQIPSSLLQPADNAAGWGNAGNKGIRIEQHASAKLKEAAPDSIAYVMHTSGSTGTPQAVLGTSAGILNRCRWMQRVHPFSAGDIVCFHTAPTFVDSVWQIFGPLLGGVPMLVLPPPASRNMDALLTALRQHAVTHFVAVPTLLAALLQHVELSGQQMPPTLRLLVSSGEPLPVRLLRRLQTSLPPHAVVLNLYGSTETAADCTCCNATAWLQGNASRVTAPAATSLPCSPHPSATKRLGAAVHQHHAQPSAQIQQSPALSGQQRADTANFSHNGGSQGVGQETAGKSTVSHAGGNLQGGQGASQLEGGVSEQSSGGIASEHGEYVPVGWSLDNMAVFIAAPISEGQEDGSESEDGVGGCINASDVLDWGTVGEVCVMGTGICAGYLRQLEQAGHRFSSFPRDQLEAASHMILWGERTSSDGPLPRAERVFRTGDLGIITFQGLEIRGRLNLQAKINGVRIDLVEIEGVLAAHPQVVAAAAKVWPAGPRGGQRLCAYVELREPQCGAETCAQLRIWCLERLSPAAVPPCIIPLPALPRSSAGKIQRGDLPSPADLTQSDTFSPSHLHMQGEDVPGEEALPLPDGFPYSGPGGLEAAAMRAFGAALGQGPCGLEPVTDFWSAGGDSLAAAQVAGWLGVDVRLLTAFPTARALAAQMRSTQATKPGQASDPRETLGNQAEASRLAGDAHNGHSTGGFVPNKRPRLIRQEPEQESGGADWMLTQPDPALGGAVLQSCGRVSFRPAAVSGADVQSAAALPAGGPSALAAAAMSAHPPTLPSVAETGSDQTAGTQQQHSAQHRDIDTEEAEASQQQLAGLRDDAAQEIEDRLCAKRGWEVPGAEQGVTEGEGHDTTTDGKAWRVSLRDCVDASPVILVQSAWSSQSAPGHLSSQQSALSATANPSGRADSADQQAGKLPLRWYAVGCSHGGDVVCIDGGSGTPVWKTCIEGRADSGLTLTRSLQHVAVASSSGRLHFLRTADGTEVGSCDAGGALKAAPVTDPWLGHIWIASHARELLVCKAPGKVILRQPCTSPVSASVGFHAGGRRAYVGTLDGSLTAWDVVCGSDGAEGGDALRLAVAWSMHICGPIFAAPSVVPDTASVIIADAKGLVMAVSAAGEVLWKSELGSAVFASPCFLPGPEHGYQALFGCQNGLLNSLRCTDGCVQWLQQVGIAGISTSATLMISSDYISRLLVSSAAPEESTLEPQRASVEVGKASTPEKAEHASMQACMNSAGVGKEVMIACCDNSGVVGRFGFDKVFSHELLMLEHMSLGSEVFSSPVAFDGCIMVGCRDDHLYCLTSGTVKP